MAPVTLIKKLDVEVRVLLGLKQDRMRRASEPAKYYHVDKGQLTVGGETAWD